MVFAPGPVGVLFPQWTLIVIAAGVVIARVYLRLKIQQQRLLGTDILMCLAWVAAVATASFDVKFALMGALEPYVMTSLDGYEGSDENKLFFGKLFWISGVPFFTAFYLCKAALLALYLQIIPSFMFKRRLFLWFTIVFVALSFVTSVVMLFVKCLPMESNWSIDPKKKCSNDNVAIIFQVTWSLHFFGDLLIFAVPWTIVPGLQMKWKLKLSVYCTFLLGLINIVFCLLRAITMQTSQVDNALPISLVEFWSALDLNVTLVIACLPSLRPYFKSKQATENSYSYGTNERSATRRQNEPGFKMIRESTEVRIPKSAASQDPGGGVYLSADLVDDEPWAHRTKSDIELVEVKSYYV